MPDVITSANRAWALGIMISSSLRTARTHVDALTAAVQRQDSLRVLMLCEEVKVSCHTAYAAVLVLEDITGHEEVRARGLYDAARRSLADLMSIAHEMSTSRHALRLDIERARR